MTLHNNAQLQKYTSRPDFDLSSVQWPVALLLCLGCSGSDFWKDLPHLYDEDCIAEQV